MTDDKKWKILNKFQEPTKKLLPLLLENRGIKTKKAIEDFLHPEIKTVTTEAVGIAKKPLQKALERIQKAITEKEEIVVYGDYDVDGITATAILWETLYALGAKVTPYIPHRIDEGYGLSIKGIENCKLKNENCKLIITVDNGIVANDAVEFANQKGIDVIITDHHTKGDTLPNAFAIIHTTKVCGAGVAYLLAQSFTPEVLGPFTSGVYSDHLSLVALATVADLVPLTECNRTLLTYGLQQLRTTARPGIIALCNEAKIQQEHIGVYEIGHMLGPRLNAMGRMESAMDSLRLLCTKDRLRAKVLANKLEVINKQRQDVTLFLSQKAISIVSDKRNLLFIADEEFQEGIIGLIAGKLVEKFYRPAIVVALGKKVSKGSARSIPGFNIIESIRQSNELLLNAGGHPMAAGFTIATEKIGLLQKALEKLAEESLEKDLLQRVIKIDCELPLSLISQEMYDNLQTLAPFGMGNPEPTFVSRNIVVEDIKAVGKEGNHLKLKLQIPSINAIAFNMGEMAAKIKPGDSIDIVYTIDENIWQNKKELQLKIKDIHTKKQ